MKIKNNARFLSIPLRSACKKLALNELSKKKFGKTEHLVPMSECQLFVQNTPFKRNNFVVNQEIKHLEKHKFEAFFLDSVQINVDISLRKNSRICIVNYFDDTGQD